MLRPLLVLCLLLLAASLSAQESKPPPEPTEQPLDLAAGTLEAPPEDPLAPRFRDLGDFVDGLVLGLKHEHQLAALTVAVVADDDLVLARAYGHSDIAAGTSAAAERSLFRIGSVSKTFTWTAAMMLAERGRLDLDADVNSYLRNVRVNDAFGAPVTMRHLMHHRAGFEDTMRVFAVADNDARSLAELLAEHQPQRVFAPGTRTSYSNWGSALAAQVVEDVAGIPYGEFLQREILDPLRMRDTLWIAPGQMGEAARARLATGYRRQQAALKVQGYMQIGNYWPAGGIASTATDMARWMRFHLNRGELEGMRLLRADTHAQMWTRAFDDRPAANDLAHGFQDRNFRGVRTFGHGGGTAAFLTNMVLVPELGLGVFVSQNGTWTREPIAQLADRIVERHLDLSPAPLIATEAGPAGVLAEFAGTYLQNRRTFTSFAKLFSAMGAVTVSAPGGNALLAVGGGEARRYASVQGERDVFEAADGSRIAFLRDAQGRVLAVADSSGVHTLERVAFLQSPLALMVALGVAALLSVSMLLGFWWRLGRPDYASFASTVAAGIGLLATLTAVGFFVLLVMLGLAFNDFDLSTMPGNYPLPAMQHVHYAGWAVAGAAAAMLLALWPAWSGSGWGLWRRFHFSLFALALVFLAFQLWQWKVFAAPLY